MTGRKEQRPLTLDEKLRISNIEKIATERVKQAVIWLPRKGKPCAYCDCLASEEKEGKIICGLQKAPFNKDAECIVSLLSREIPSSSNWGDKKIRRERGELFDPLVYFLTNEEIKILQGDESGILPFQKDVYKKEKFLWVTIRGIPCHNFRCPFNKCADGINHCSLVRVPLREEVCLLQTLS